MRPGSISLAARHLGTPGAATWANLKLVVCTSSPELPLFCITLKKNPFMQNSQPSRDRVFNMRLSESETEQLKQLAVRHGYKSMSAFLRDLIQDQLETDGQATQKRTKGNALLPKPKKPALFYGTKLGKIYHGDSLGLFSNVLKPATVDLVVTSPPFGLVRKKEYGNVPADEYVDWFRPFAEGIRNVLRPNGSLVIDIGPAWTQGAPTKSLYQFELLLMLCKEFGFYLAQDFYWWNPCRMPAPAEWVNVRRLRVKDAVNPVWWLSPTPWPKASNSRVLTAYGKDQEKLFRNGYNAGLRPSGHKVSKNWGRDNGGAVPPNLIAAANTTSDDAYHKYCRKMRIAPHPARFPRRLPEFFIRMLTDKSDLVVDPFGGSCLTGAVAEDLGRKWVCCELREPYLKGALGRFTQDTTSIRQVEGYTVPASLPAALDKEVPLLDCGGEKFRAKAGNKKHSVAG